MGSQIFQTFKSYLVLYYLSPDLDMVKLLTSLPLLRCCYSLRYVELNLLNILMFDSHSVNRLMFKSLSTQILKPHFIAKGKNTA